MWGSNVRSVTDIPALADRPPVTVRRPTFDLSDLPDRWLAGSRWATAFGDAGHVFIPLGEAFFVDSVRDLRDRIDDPELKRRVNAFLGQESAHARAHRAVWDHLEAKGAPVDGFAAFIGAIRSAEPAVPATLRLAVTAALEHYTAAFGHAFLAEDLGEAVPDEMARLLAWHGLEELEHRDVAFDVLAAVDDRYVVRLAGFAVGTAMLVVVPLVGTVWFGLATGTSPDAPPPAPVALDALGAMVGRFGRRAGRHVLRYLRPGYHPAADELPADFEVRAVGLNPEGPPGR